MVIPQLRPDSKHSSQSVQEAGQIILQHALLLLLPSCSSRGCWDQGKLAGRGVPGGPDARAPAASGETGCLLLMPTAKVATIALSR